MTERKPKKFRERPSLSILCEMYGAACEPDAMQYWYGTNGFEWCQQYMEACSEVGDRLHTALEFYENGGTAKQMPEDPREVYMVNLGIQWLKETGAKPVEVMINGERRKAIELDVTSHLLDYTARLDRIHVFGDSPTKWIGDYKTSADIRKAYPLQLAGYAIGVFELTGEWIDQGYLLRFEKNPNKYPQIRATPVYELHRWIEPLVCLRMLWDQINRRGEWADYGKYGDKSM